MKAICMLLLCNCLTSCGKTSKADSYPLTTCIVSGEKLESMGQPPRSRNERITDGGFLGTMFLTGLLTAGVSLAVYLHALKHESLEMARTPLPLWSLLNYCVPPVPAARHARSGAKITSPISTSSPSSPFPLASRSGAITTPCLPDF